MHSQGRYAFTRSVQAAFIGPLYTIHKVESESESESESSEVRSGKNFTNDPQIKKAKSTTPFGTSQISGDCTQSTHQLPVMNVSGLRCSCRSRLLARLFGDS